MSNFDKMTDDGRMLFLGYDQDRMIRKYGMPADDRFLYFWMLGRLFRIERKTGYAEICGRPVPLGEWTDMKAGAQETAGAGTLPLPEADWSRAENGVAMTLYDVLCYGKDDAAAENDFINIDSLVTLISAAGNPGGGLLNRYVKLFDAHPAELEQTLVDLGGVPQGKADVSYEHPLFDFMKIRFQLWHADDEFPAMTQIFVDKGILSYMHFETVWYLMHYYMELLTEETEMRIGGHNHVKRHSDALY